MRTLWSTVAGCIVVVLAREGLAHEAKSGWRYPLECCSLQDCYEIEESAVHLNQDGSYTILATTERFWPPGKAPKGVAIFPPQEFRWSPDGRFHRCSSNGFAAGSTFCLFIPQPGA